MIKWISKPDAYQIVAITLLTLSACSSDPASESANLTSTTTVEENPPLSSDANGPVDNEPSSVSADTPSNDWPITQRIKQLMGRTLIPLNQAINQGQTLTMQQENCIGAFDPALGEALLSIDCKQPLATGDVAIYIAAAGFEPTNGCHADLFASQYDACTVDFAEITVTTLWTQPTFDNEQQARRPVPLAGASISYAMQSNVMTIENLPAALTGRFSCEFDINSQLAASENQAQNCDQLLQDLISLIDLHLS
jgi:hypothetical protein